MSEKPLNLNRIRRQTLPVAFGCVFISVTIFGGLGYFLDYTLDKKPLFLIIGLVVAFVTTDVLIIVFSKKLWKRSA